MKPQTLAVKYLLASRELSAKQARHLHNIHNLSARVCELRQAGYNVYSFSQAKNPRKVFYGLSV